MTSCGWRRGDLERPTRRGAGGRDQRPKHQCLSTPTGDRFDGISAPRIVTENLTLVAPRFGSGLGLVPYLTTNNAGQQVLRLLATNVPVKLTARGVYAASPTNAGETDWPINYPTNFIWSLT